MTKYTSSWQDFVDQIAAPLRLEPAHKMRFGLVAALTIVAQEWGDIILLRAAERLIAVHYFSIDDLCAEAESPNLTIWFAAWLAGHGHGQASPAPSVSEVVKPAYSYS